MRESLVLPIAMLPRSIVVPPAKPESADHWTPERSVYAEALPASIRSVLQVLPEAVAVAGFVGVLVGGGSVGVLVAVPVGGSGVLVGAEPPGMISMALISALLTRAVNVMFSIPLVTVVVKVLRSARKAPPASANTSKLLSTPLPLIATLNTRRPAAVKYVSAKCRITV